MFKILLICTIVGSFILGSNATPITVEPGQTITGIVTDSVTGEPIPDVIIMVKGTDIGTVTNAKGRYIFIATANSTLTYSKEGMKTQEILVGEKTTIDVKLKKESKDTKSTKQTSH